MAVQHDDSLIIKQCTCLCAQRHLYFNDAVNMCEVSTAITYHLCMD